MESPRALLDDIISEGVAIDLYHAEEVLSLDGLIGREAGRIKAKADATRPELEESDKRNLSKAISGFVNTSGGSTDLGIGWRSPAPAQADP